MSHPMWVRELKLHLTNVNLKKWTSHPMWVRELKLNLNPLLIRLTVAPYVGA